MRASRCALWVLALTAGCELGVAAPSAEVPVRVQLTVEEVDSTLISVLEKVRRVRLELARDGQVVDTVIPAGFVGGAVVARVALMPPAGEGALTVHAEVGTHSVLLFVGDGVVPRDGAEASARIAMTPVPAYLTFSILPVVEALGEAVALDASGRFATGDPWPGWQVEYEVSDPSLVELQPGAVAVSRGNGRVDIIASLEGRTNTQPLLIAQRPVALSGVGPADTTVAVGASFVMRPFGEDPNGYPLLPGAQVSWSATGGVSVDTLGVVLASSAGAATVEAAVGATVHIATVTVVP